MTALFEQRDPAAMLGFLNRVCESKVRYPSAGAALKAQHWMVTTSATCVAQSAAGCDVYRCRFCGEFHLGHSRRKPSGTSR